MRDKKRASVKEMHFFRKMLILVICIALLGVNTLSTLSVNAATDNTEEEMESVDDASETNNAKRAETEGVDAKETEITDAKETETATSSEEERSTVSESEKESETENQKMAGVTRAGTPTEVGTWQEFVNALANTAVDHILLTTDLTRPSTTANNPGTIARDLIIDGAGYSINFGSGGTTSNGILLSGTTATTLTLINVTLTKTDTTGTAIFSTSGGGANWNINLNNVKTNTSITGTSNAAGLISATGASVSVYGTDNNLSFHNTGGSLFNVGSFTMSAGSSMTATARSTGNLFKVNSGNFTLGDGAVLTAVSTTSTISTTLFSFDIGGNFIMGANSQLTATSSGTSLFQVGGSFTMEDGTTSLEAITNSGISNTYYQFRIIGNFAMGKGTTFKTSTTTTTTSTTYYQVDVGGSFTMGAGSQLTATSVGASLFNVGADFIMEDGLTELIAETTATTQTNDQFNISGDFVMGNGTKFTTATATTASIDTYYQVRAANFTVGNNAVLKAESAAKSLFGITGGFTVGESATVETNTTNGANRQFSVKDFTAKANAVIMTTSAGATFQFYLTGNFTMESNGTEGTGASLTANATGASNTVIYIISNGKIDLGAYTVVQITNSGTSTAADADTVPTTGAGTAAQSNGIYGLVREFNMQAHSLLEINASNVGYRSGSANATFKMVDGAVFNSTSSTDGAFNMCLNWGDAATGTTIAIEILGKGTQMNLQTSSTQTDMSGQAMRLQGVNNRVTIADGAELNISTKTSTGVYVVGAGTEFNVQDGAKLEITQESSNSALNTSFRFRLSGNQVLNIDNAKMIITKNGGSAPIMRLYGGGNAINVINGGEFRAYNAGSGTASDGNGTNDGLHYTGSNATRTDSFFVSGYGSKVEVIADYGPALYMGGSTSSITVENQAIFIATGMTSTASNGVVNSNTYACEITLDHPMYFDIRNNRPGGGRSIDATVAASTFTTIQSDLSVWKNGSVLDGDPSATWSLFDYKLNGVQYANIVSSSISDFNSTTYGRASDYSRISANNAAAVVDEIRVSTNADKYIYGHAYVQEGLGGQRDAWTDEVYVTVQVKDGENIVFTGMGATVGAANDGSDKGLSIYGEEGRGGIFEILYDPDGDGVGDYLPVGYTIEVIAAWRGVADSDSDRAHISSDDDLQADMVTTRDVTPPAAITVDDLNASVRMYEGKLTTRATGISGTSEEIGAKICLYADDGAPRRRVQVA